MSPTNTEEGPKGANETDSPEPEYWDQQPRPHKDTSSL